MMQTLPFELPSIESMPLHVPDPQAHEAAALPACIRDNLNPAFPIRPYQARAFLHFLDAWQTDAREKPEGERRRQMLFHMATGSGKTLLMAGLMLYLFERGYRHFLFFVNNTAIIGKTRDNFLNPQSPKYLFAPRMHCGGRQIAVREVENFQAPQWRAHAGDGDGDIEIIFSTIQGLHAALSMPRENGLCREDFADRRIVLISDEAHHINAETKKRSTLRRDDICNLQSWEATVESIFAANTGNVLLEFTATVDFNDAALAEKYQPRLIFDYPLREFRRDGYSKEISVLQADLPPFERALQAMVLSQYRRKVFERYGHAVKPVILFKSKTIRESRDFFEEFRQSLRRLCGADLEALRNKEADTAMRKAFRYFDDNGILPENLAAELQEDFADDRLIVVNSQEDGERKQLAVNALESNGYRAVFAVDMLNEGWDVLNLFDIVRLYDTRDGKAGKIGATTMSEAQLIGRGARYYPFRMHEDQPLFARKFDHAPDHPLRIGEELTYHSARNPQYIRDLGAALRTLGIDAEPARAHERKDDGADDVLPRTATRRAGGMRTGMDGLDKDIIGRRYPVALHTGHAASHALMDDASPTTEGIGVMTTQVFALADFGPAVVRKACQRLGFYEFANLRKRFPQLQSLRELIASEKYLGAITLEISGAPEQLAELSSEQKLHAAIEVLTAIAELISRSP